MKKIKKVIALVLAAATALGMSACSGGKKDDGGVPTITWIVPGDDQPDLASVLEEANKIVEEKIGAKLDIQFVPTGSYSEKMKMNMASGYEYDICFTSDWLNNYDDAVRNGGLYDLTPYMDDIKTIIPEEIIKNVSYDGKIYAIPNIQIYALPLAVKARKDLLKKYNFDLQSIKTVEDVEPFLETIKTNEPELYPYRSLWSVSPWVRDTAMEFGASCIHFDYNTHQVCPSWEVEEWMNGVMKLREWYKKGYIRSDVDSQGDDTTEYKQGKYAVCIDSWKPGQEATDPDYEYKIVCPARKEINTGVSTMTAIGAKSKNPDKAFEFIKLINTDAELYNIICNGLEGVHYNFNDEGKIVNVENSGYNPNSDWEFGNQFNAYVKEGMDADVWEKTKKLNDESLDNPLAGFHLDKEPISVELSNINAVIDEYRGNDCTGLIAATDFDKHFAEFKEKLEVAGIDKALKEIESQVNKHLGK